MGHGDEHRLVTGGDGAVGQTVPLGAQHQRQLFGAAQKGVIDGAGVLPQGQRGGDKALLFQQRQPGCSILFIGAEDGMENKIVPREGFRLETLKISNFQRKLTPAAIAHNLQTAAHLSESRRKVHQILTSFHPDIVIGTGGYASFPALREGARLSIPTMVHESNAVPGLTTRMVEKYMDRIMVSFEDSRASYHDPEKVVVTGTPVREEFLYTRRQAAREKLGLD